MIAGTAVTAAMVLVGAASGEVSSPAQRMHGLVPSGTVLVAQVGSTPQFGSSYGYQPYDDRNPTGFFHPNGMGYGSYYVPPKYHGHRFKALKYRKFRGY